MKALDAIEEWARRMIEAALATPVAQHDDGSRNGMHDLKIAYSDRAPGAVEVTREVDGASVALGKLLYRHETGRWIIPNIKGGWIVSVHPAANGKRLVNELPRFLEALEAANCRAIDTAYDNPRHVNVQYARHLGIVHADQGDTAYPGSVYPVVELLGERSGGMVADNADKAGEWIGAFLRAPKQADVLAKLAASGADERHVFVIIAGLGEPSFGVFDPLARDGVGAPTAPPDLPPEVTHVWITTTWNGGRGLRWEPATGWSWFDRLME